MVKRFVLIVAVFTLMLCVAPVVTTDVAVANALAPYSCVSAADTNFTNYALTRACLWDLEDNCCNPLGDPWY